MELPADTLKRYSTPKAHAPRSEHEELVNKFVERLNVQRLKDGYPGVTYGRIAKAVKDMSNQELYTFLRECEGARSFGSFFWWKLKTKMV